MGDVVTASDGLPARAIKPHTREKFYLHERYCRIFNTAMSAQWTDNRGYLELFAGCGLAVGEKTGDELPGCPLTAATLEPHGFHKLAYVELDEELAQTLEQRLRARGVGPERAQVFVGDANDPAVVAQALSFLPSPGLHFAFIDPEDINNEWPIVEQLAAARKDGHRVDLLINLPLGAMLRAYGNGHHDPIDRVIGDNDWPAAIAQWGDTARGLREHYDGKLRALGFTVEHRDVTVDGKGVVVYDLVFASRAPRGVDLWKRIQEIGPHGQRALFY